MKHRSYNLILATMMVPGLLMFSNKASASTGTLQMDDFSVPVGGTVSVPLILNVPAGGDIAGFSVTLTYDKSVINIASKEDVTLNEAFINKDSITIDNSEYTSLIEGFDVPVGTTLTGSVKLADIEFTAVAPTADTTSIDITATDDKFYDSSKAEFDPLPQMITVTANVTDGEIPDTNNAPEFEAVDGPLFTNKKAPTTFTFHAHDEDEDTLEYSLGEDAPEGATIDPQTGEFFWIPQMEGEFTFDIIVSDGQDTDTESVTIIVGPQLDYVPGPFDLTPIFNAEPGSVQTSNEITITDIEAPITIAIHGNDGEYSINGGDFTSEEGTVFLGDKVIVRQTASAQLGSTVTTTLHLAGLSEDFNVTTRGDASAINNDSCGRDCERYKEYRREYKSDENKEIYQMVKEMKKKDPERFRYLRELYTENKHLTSDEREEALDDKTLWEFKMYKKYNGYRHYRNLKEKVD